MFSAASPAARPESSPGGEGGDKSSLPTGRGTCRSGSPHASFWARVHGQEEFDVIGMVGTWGNGVLVPVRQMTAFAGLVVCLCSTSTTAKGGLDEGLEATWAKL